jgi:hypothetical protein
LQYRVIFGVLYLIPAVSVFIFAIITAAAWHTIYPTGHDRTATDKQATNL